MSVCLASTYLFVISLAVCHLSVCLSSTCLSVIYLSIIYLSVCNLAGFLSIILSGCKPVCLSSICLPVIYLSACHISVFLSSISLSVCKSVYVLFIFLVYLDSCEVKRRRHLGFLKLACRVIRFNGYQSV